MAVRVECLRLVMPPDAFAVDHTAAWLHAGDTALPPNSDIDLPAPRFFLPAPRGRLRRPGLVSGRRDVTDDDLLEIGGIRTTSPVRTAWDMGRLERPDMALWGMDLMMRIGGFRLEELLDGLTRFKGARGVIQLRSLAPWADPGSESFGESAMRGRWRIAGLPVPETQISLREHGVEVARLDMGLPDALFAAEYDGEEHHGEGDEEHDRRRRSWICERRGFDITVLRREHVFGRHQDADVRLRRAYANARARLPTKRHFLLSS